MKYRILVLAVLAIGLLTGAVFADYLARVPLVSPGVIYGLSEAGVSVWEDLGMCAIVQASPDGLKSLEARGFRPEVLDEVRVQGAYYTAYPIAPQGEAVIRQWGKIFYTEGGAAIIWVPNPDAFVLSKGPLMLRRLGHPLVIAKPGNDILPAVTLNPFVQAMVAAVRMDSCMAALRRLQRFRTRYSTTDSGFAASGWARDKYRAYRANLPQDTVELPAWSNADCPNVVLERPGFVHPETSCVLGGHIDSYATSNAPGADDNGTGAVAAIEAARVMKAYDFELTARFCAFSGEEQGLYGSDSLARIYWHRGDHILGMLNFDMIGHVDASPESLDVMGRSSGQDNSLMNFVKAAADSYTTLKVKLQNLTLNASDHASFWARGYTATCQIEDYPLHNPSYHSAADTIGIGPTPGMNDSLFFVNSVRCAVAAFATLCRPFRVNGVESGSPSVAEAGLALLPIAPNPANGSSLIRFFLPRSAEVDLSVYDVAGRGVKTLLSDARQAGPGSVRWDGKGRNGFPVPSGIYFIRLRAEGQERTGRLILVR